MPTEQSLVTTDRETAGPIALIVYEIVRFGVAQGADLHDLLDRVGWHPDRPVPPTSRVCQHRAIHLWEPIADSCGDRNPAALLSQSSTRSFRALTEMTRDAETGLDALQVLARALPQITSGARLDVVPDGDRVAVQIAYDGGISGSPIELAFGLIRRLLVAPDPMESIVGLELEHDRIGRLQDYAGVFGERVRFSADRNVLWLSSDAVLRPRRRSRDPLLSCLSPGPGPSLRGASTDFRSTVVTAIEVCGARGRFDLHSISGYLAMGGRTLQRRAAEEGFSVRELVAEVRLRHSKRLLEDGRLSVSGVACRLGYSSERSFRRAFLARTGETPAVWRDRR
ncbi:MAG: helix-turn-helix domain-containing protein [Planctomycetota bacterium]